jgi:tRNA (adenine37-N6)-methyltransferase
MASGDPLRPGEQAITFPDQFDAHLVFIGRIRTPFLTRHECPRQGNSDGPVCRIEVAAPWQEAVAGLERYGHIEVLYWMHHARRDLICQSPKANGRTTGTFSLRSPLRPNPIATSVCVLIGLEPGVLLVRGLDCLDGTPLLDLKPHRGELMPLAADRPGDPVKKPNPWCAATGEG